MSISRSKSRQFNWKRKRKKGKKKLLSFQKKAASSARLLFFWTRRKKKQAGEEGEEKKFSSRVLFFKKEEKTTPSFIEEELNNARLKIETLRTIRSYSPHFRVPCILSSVFFQAFRWWEQSLWTFFFLYFFFLFFPLLAWVGSLLGKLLKFFASPPLLSFLLSLAFVVLFLR